MKVTQMPPVHMANLVANSDNTAYGVERILTSALSSKMCPNESESNWHWSVAGSIGQISAQFWHIIGSYGLCAHIPPSSLWSL